MRRLRLGNFKELPIKQQVFYKIELLTRSMTLKVRDGDVYSFFGKQTVLPVSQ